MDHARQNWMLLLALAALSAPPGCCLSRTRTFLEAPRPLSTCCGDHQGRTPETAEAAYASALSTESEGSADCVDFYYQCAAHCWKTLRCDYQAGAVPSERTASLYHSAVARMLTNAQRFGRWSPCEGLKVHTPEGWSTVPARHKGFEWAPNEFQSLHPVGDYHVEGLACEVRVAGLGVPLAVVRQTTCPQPFTNQKQTFSATVLLRDTHGGSGFCLSFYDPLRVATTCVSGQQLPLSRDLSAPFALAKQGHQRDFVRNFLFPGTNDSEEGLFMLEPYQRGKVPVIFVHGLLSDPQTWASLVNDLRARPALNDRFQWWGFRYATGKPFLGSAVLLRRQLVEIQETYDPTDCDRSLRNMVIIGHSMGGLISKLQVTESGDQLWNAVATRPLSTVQASPDILRRLRDDFYFHASPSISRIVFAGVPHTGSPWAQRPIGLAASRMVKPPAADKAAFDQLIRDNPNLIRSGSTGRFPTSIDLLNPRSRLLAATAALPYSPRVSLHSIVGTARTTLHCKKSDGIVPLSSARLWGVSTELEVDATHTKLHKNQKSVQEIECILRRHLGSL